MSKPTVEIRCRCCGKPGLHRGRRLITACYERYRYRGTLDQFPRSRQEAKDWAPTAPKGRRTLARYAELVAERATPARIRWELSLSPRQIQRYAAAHRAAQTQNRKAG